MKQFSCGDVVPGCGRVFVGDQDSILAAVGQHAQVDHGLVEVPSELVEQVVAHMVPAAAS